MARLRGAAGGAAPDRREGLLLPAGPPGAAAGAHRPGAAGRADQDVPGAQQDPLQGRQRRAQGNSVFQFSSFMPLRSAALQFCLFC